MTPDATPAPDETIPSSTPDTPEVDSPPAQNTQASQESSPEDDAARYKDLFLRAQADFDNYRKRAARDRDEAIRFANTSLLERLLPILDNFELGLDAASKAADAAGILQGMAMVQRQLQDFLRESGVEAVDAQGAPFDPNLHDAIGQEASNEHAEGIIVRQLRKGYRLKDRLLRPATVIVSRGPEAAAQP